MGEVKGEKGIEPGYQAQLEMLRDWTTQTGLLHEAQVLQLRLWSIGAVPHGRPTVKVDMEAKVVHLQYVSADVISPKMLEAFRSSVRWLLGEDWIVKPNRKSARG